MEMQCIRRKPWRRRAILAGLALAAAAAPACATSIAQLAPQLAVGDVVFIRVSALPFRKIATATQSWTNHVGIVTDVSGAEPEISESTFPRARTTSLSRFVARSQAGRLEVSRLNAPLSTQQIQQIQLAARQRLGVFYDTGFDLHSRRQFCSRYVHEVLAEATGHLVGDRETLAMLLARNPDTDLGFWRLWYFGRIPFQRETITPASLQHSTELHTVFDGYAG